MKINKKSEEDEENEIKNKALIELITGAIDYFKFSNSEMKPDTVIIYMKGGTEKQTEKIIRFILPDILKLFSGNKEEKCYEENYEPKLTVFSVNKRTELKFFERAQSGYKNIPVGNISKVVTRSKNNHSAYGYFFKEKTSNDYPLEIHELLRVHKEQFCIDVEDLETGEKFHFDSMRQIPKDLFSRSSLHPYMKKGIREFDFRRNVTKKTFHIKITKL
jgi:hypothetical protein